MEYDTNIGGSVRIFPTTVWADILSAGDPAHPAYREALDRLFRTYWKPVYAYIRAAWRKSNEDAKDLAQAFFTHLLEKDTMAKMRPERGSFRGYLKIALSHFLVDAQRREAVRQPAGPVFRLDAKDVDLERLEPPAPGLTPEQAYDREWFRKVLDAGVDLLRAELIRDGKGAWWDAFRMYCLEPGASPGQTPQATIFAETPSGGPTYREIAMRLNLSETQVRHYLSHCRGALRRHLRDRIRSYTIREEDVDPELAEVLRG